MIYIIRDQKDLVLLNFEIRQSLQLSNNTRVFVQKKQIIVKKQKKLDK